MNDSALSPETGVQPRGRYYNYFHLTHSREEFLLSFGQLLPGDTQPRVEVRVVTTATWAQVLHQVLGEALTHYRQAYGSIPPPEGGDGK
jgi:hypothetical protein